MELESGTQIFAVGFLGGVCNEVVHWWNLRENPNLPEYSKLKRYWIITALMALFGGVAALMFCGDRSTVLAALQIGLTTPMLLQRLSATLPNLQGARGGAVSIRSFLRG